LAGFLEYKLFEIISYRWMILDDLMIFSDHKWEFHGKKEPQPNVLCQKEPCCRDNVRKQLFFSRVMTLFWYTGHLVLSVLTTLHLSVSLSSYFILFLKAHKSRMCNSLAVKGYLGKRRSVWVVSGIFACGGSGVSGRVAFAYCNVL